MTSLDRSSGGILFLAAFEPELAPLRQRLGALEGARFAANADVDSSLGAPRTVEIVGQATSDQTARGLRCTSTEEADPTGLTIVAVRCSGSVPTLLAGLGNLLPVEITGRAVKETP